MNQQQPNWQQDYAQWIQMIGQNAMQGQGNGGGGNTGMSQAPQGMMGTQYMNQPQMLNGGQAQFPPPAVQPDQSLMMNGIYQAANQKYG